MSPHNLVKWRTFSLFSKLYNFLAKLDNSKKQPAIVLSRNLNFRQPVSREQEPPPLRSEVARAIHRTASRKATGPDEVPAELFKAGGDTVLDRMHRICVAIWETGERPEEWTFSTFIPLPKKGDLKQCANYRRTALVSHASKIHLRIILQRIQVKTETEIADKQAGFQ